MRVVRRFVFTAVFLVASVLMIRAAKQYGDFLYLFYPGIIREVQAILSELTAQLDYLLWERIAFAALIWAGVTLLLDLILQENLLRWVSGVTAVAAALLCVYIGLSGLNHYAPSIAEGMRMEVRTGYSTNALSQAAAYYRDGANRTAEQISRDASGTPRPAPFEQLADEVGSGMHNMIRTSYVFGGSTIPPKELGYLSRYDIPSLFCCFTGECCVNSNLDRIAMPFVMSRETAHRMSIARDGDAAFLAVLSCIASDSPDYNYSGYFMAYRFCMDVLATIDQSEADRIAAGESDLLRADRARCTYTPDESLGVRWLARMEELDKKELDGEASPEPPDLVSLLVGWHIQLTRPAPIENAA